MFQRLRRDIGLLILRVGFGGLMLVSHGWGKLVNFGEKAQFFPDPIGLGPQLSMAMAIFSEFFCAAAIVFGLLTRLAAVPLVITMLVAALIVHADDPFSKKEFVLLYAIPFITLICTGPGKLSLDGFFLKREQ